VEQNRTQEYHDLVAHGTKGNIKATITRSNGFTENSLNGQDLPVPIDGTGHVVGSTGHVASVPTGVDQHGVSHVRCVRHASPPDFCPLVPWDHSANQPKTQPLKKAIRPSELFLCSSNKLHVEGLGRVSKVNNWTAEQFVQQNNWGKSGRLLDCSTNPSVAINITYFPMSKMSTNKHGCHAWQRDAQGIVIAALLVVGNGSGNPSRWPFMHRCKGRRILNIEKDNHWCYGVFRALVVDDTSNYYHRPLELVTVESVHHTEKTSIAAARTVARGRAMDPSNGNNTVAVVFDRPDPERFAFTGLKASFCELTERGISERKVIGPDLLSNAAYAPELEDLRLTFKSNI
jgi:hypothetical protein